ncbi:MAG TPA: DNA recombination protein RmuC [Candidatus Saccharimonadales bacterium]|nr:DNA recombination protein RmuC [Candidatus Saccharimonadales bacterium]
MLAAVIFLGILCLVLVGFLVWQSLRPKTDSDSAMLLKADMTELTKSMNKLKDDLQNQLTAQLGTSNKQMAAQFQASAKIITDVTEKLTELDKTNKQVGDVAAELKTLQNVLQNPKQRGGVGEYYLDSVLKNVLPPGIYQMQYGFKDGQIVDAVIFLDKKMLPIDSKFSLENYNRMIEEKDLDKREALISLFKADVKKRVDETSKYIRPREGTTDFAFMFIPSEAIYYDLLANKIGASKTSARDLIDYAFRDKKVIIVSPTTMLAYLQTVMQGLRALKIEEQAKEIQIRVGELGRHLTNHETYMQKLGGSLGTTVNHFNAAHKELKKVDKDVVKIAESSPGVDPMLLDRPNMDED